MKKNVILLFVVLMTSGCEHKSIWNRFNEIESLTDCEQYDSAHVELSRINEHALSSEDEKAHYYLLRTQLGYLTQKPDTTNMLDSLVIPYFLQKKNHKNLANAYYYKGYGEVTKGDYAKATYYYKKAEEAYPSINSSEYEQQLLEGIRLADKDMAYDAVNRLIRSLKENPLEDAGEVKFENRLINQEETSVCLIRNCM